MTEQDKDQIVELYRKSNEVSRKLEIIGFYKNTDTEELLRDVANNLSDKGTRIFSTEHPLDKVFQENKKVIHNFLINILEVEENKTIKEKENIKKQIENIEVKF